MTSWGARLLLAADNRRVTSSVRRSQLRLGAAVGPSAGRKMNGRPARDVAVVVALSLLFCRCCCCGDDDCGDRRLRGAGGGVGGLLNVGITHVAEDRGNSQRTNKRGGHPLVFWEEEWAAMTPLCEIC